MDSYIYAAREDLWESMGHAADVRTIGISYEEAKAAQKKPPGKQKKLTG